MRRLLRRLRLRLARACRRLAYLLHELAADPADRRPRRMQDLLYVPAEWSGVTA